MELNREFLVPVKGITTLEDLRVFFFVQRVVLEKIVPVIQIFLPEISGLPICLVYIDEQSTSLQSRKNSSKEQAFVFRGKVMNRKCGTNDIVLAD